MQRTRRGAPRTRGTREVAGPVPTDRDLSVVDSGDALGETAVRWAWATLGSDAGVSLSRPDARGHLRAAWKAGRGLEAGRTRSARRRQVFESGVPLRLDPSTGAGESFVILPLVVGHETVAVMEVTAPTNAIDRSLATLSALADHVAVALRADTERRALLREVRVIERAARLGRDFVRASSADSAIRVATRFIAKRLEVPAVGWSELPDGSLTLVAVGGVGDRLRREIRRQMGHMPPWASLIAEERRDFERRVSELTGVEAVYTTDVGGGLLIAGGPRHEIEASLHVVGALLAEALRLHSMATLAARRIEHLDMGIAWTAHEIRGPLLGVRAVLELMLRPEGAGTPDYETLRRSLRELDRLAGTAEALLSWAVGARALELQRADLARIVDDAVQACRLETGLDGVVVRAPTQAFARVEPGAVHTALVNLVRNGLAHASPGTTVAVDVERDAERVTVSVTDKGPMIPVSEREAIFDPFVRGSAGHAGANGNGLGLFIARRIVEAHEGRILVGSDPGTTTFRVVLPIQQGAVRRAAS